MNSKDKNLMICLAGMGRSGTSLMASYLEHCGIKMGDRLLEAGKWNRKGFFEDKEFLEFHKRLIKRNKGTLYYLNEKGERRLSEADRKCAKEMVSRRAEKFGAWGWKDPRSTMFLDLWGEINNEIKFVFMYRNPYEVIESVYRTMRKKELYFQPWLAPRGWLYYNQALIDFYDRNRERCVIVNLHGFESDPDTSSQLMGNWLSISLDRPFSDVFDSRDRRVGIKSTNPFPIPMWIAWARKYYDRRFWVIYSQLNSRALISDVKWTDNA